MKHPRDNRPITLEDLLRLKRAERPSPAFWTKFESELRAKQLAAIVEKSPWWRRLTAAPVVRHRLALSAGAVLAVTLFVVRNSHTAPELVLAQTSPTASMDGAAGRVVEAVVDSSQGIAVESVVAISPPAAGVAVAASDSESHPGAAALVASSDPSSGASVQLASWSAADEEGIPGVLSPVARSIANNLAVVKEAHPELSDRFFAASDFDIKNIMPSRPVVDPLSQVRGPGVVYRKQLLASARLVSVTPSPHDSERMVRRISDERLTEEAIRRFGARGNEFSLKF